MREAGIDVARITTGMPILHPLIAAFSCVWQQGRGASERRFEADNRQIAALANSPIKIAYEGRGPYRCRLTEPPAEGEFPIRSELRDEGFADYIALSVPFSEHKALTLATTHEHGFGEEEIKLLLAIIPALAFNIEVQALRRTVRTLLETYVGRQSGHRVQMGRSVAAWARPSIPSSGSAISAV